MTQVSPKVKCYKGMMIRRHQVKVYHKGHHDCHNSQKDFLMNLKWVEGSFLMKYITMLK